MPALFLNAIIAGTSIGSFAQQQPSIPPEDDVLRVDTDLVETAITVVDQKNHFVDNLERAQFQLLVDGVPRAISFFERVRAGSVRDVNRATPGTVNGGATNVARTAAVTGRAIVFFVDDLHLSADSMKRTRDMLKHFIENEMGPKDSVAITSSSGQIGFLQQFTNNREVLEAANERLIARPYDVSSYGSGSTKMSEFDALIIDTNRSNNTVLNYYIRECVVQNRMPKNIPVAMAALAALCETQARNSARAVLMQAGAITRNTYESLESLLRSAARAPGRKLAFFISDGFLMDVGPHGAELRGRLDNLIDVARRAGVVIYTIDARGLITNQPDLRQGNARLDVGAPIGEIEANQDAMNALAGDTGGRALRNTNYFDRWVEKVLDETSNYYLLAWRPDQEEEKTPKFRKVKVTIADRPELSVRAPRGYVSGPPPASSTPVSAEEKSGRKANRTTEGELQAALGDYYPRHSLPTLLSLTYLNTPQNGPVVTSSIQIGTIGLSYGDDGKHPAKIRLAGVVLNDKGKIAASFTNQLNVEPPLGRQSDAANVIYNHHTPLAPGIYQVRAAVRDEKGGRVGSALQWIVIPDLTSRRLTLSSVLLGGQVLESIGGADVPAQIQLSVDHRFLRSARLGYWVFVYNAKLDGARATSLTAQASIIRNGEAILTSPQRRLGPGFPDPDRIPFGDELSLKSLAPGPYDLRVTITDSISGTSATQTIVFEILE